ncbi:AMP-dependent synthetase/ligase [Gulosibacter molinativorax]|uniref:Acyl-CoA synthetase n=1 Tax=Gulosibacter molinativorax TaxID=256821 RepID=A0ABT7C5B0_9MICO|nr:AMP-dependent synthetase/ligase [Gulosibacter molinativorax]MDJ1370382.1 long-chain fatty acid--CoA ligase [Gulosibacter molinativorax]QUY61295.1 Long-chain acyl-CoA synthetase [Gulosibacter molinativorax]
MTQSQATAHTDGAVREWITPAVAEPAPQLNVTDLLESRVERTPNRALFAVPEGEGWRDITAQQFTTDVRAIAKGFINAGVTPGTHIAFICSTSYEWTLVDFALWYAGAVMVPVYETNSSSQLDWILRDSSAQGLITQTHKLDARYTEIEGEKPELRWHWVLEDGALDQLIADGKSVSDEQLEAARSHANGDDVATLIYTAGTTGRPKGTVLTHSNFVELARNIEHPLRDVVAWEGASTLMFVTLAHVFARLISVIGVAYGVRVGHQGDTTQLVPALGSFKPTFLLAVPRVFEKVYNSALQKAASGGKEKIFMRAVKVGVAWSRATDEGKVPLGLKLQYKLFDKLVFSKLRETLGGNVRHAVSGSAPLGLFLGHFYRALGVQVLEGYGLTETTAPVSVNLPGAFKIGTVGPPLPGCGVRIAEDGEILTKGVNVFREYWHNPEATKDAFTEDGWFHTGDIGQLDHEGYITITGRKKDIIVTAGGKNVAPAMFEDQVRADGIVGECMVVGDGRPFVAAIVTLDPEMLPKWLELQGLNPNMSLTEASKHPTVREHIQSLIDRANRSVSRAESIRKFEILDKPFTVEDGTLTPKLSLKRHVALERYADVIEGMYAGTSTPKE